MSAMASQITSLAIVYSTVYAGAYQRKHKSSASLAFVRGNHRSPVNSPHKGPVTRKMFPFDDVIMILFRGHIRDTIYEYTQQYKLFVQCQVQDNLDRLYSWCVSFWQNADPSPYVILMIKLNTIPLRHNQPAMLVIDSLLFCMDHETLA